MIRAAAVHISIGNFRPELLSAGNAIIHDKVIVIDPCDAENCVVITGSHNLGYKASYCNDDNLLIVRGNRELAIAYAVHVIDLYDHYVFRARLEQDLRYQLKAGKIHSPEEAAEHADHHGLLPLNGKLPGQPLREQPAAVEPRLFLGSRQRARTRMSEVDAPSARGQVAVRHVGVAASRRRRESFDLERNRPQRRTIANSSATGKTLPSPGCWLFLLRAGIWRAGCEFRRFVTPIPALGQRRTTFRHRWHSAATDVVVPPIQ